MKQLVLIGAVLFAAATAHADDGPTTLGKAQKAIDDLDYETARTLTNDALASGVLLPPELARAHMLAGEVAATLGDDAGAEAHFERFILLSPDAELPSGLSPKITQPFKAARTATDAMGKASFEVSLTRGPGKVTITVDGDPLHMVARLRVRVNGGNEVQAIGNQIDVPIEDGAGITASVSILDEQGNELAHRDGNASVAIKSSSGDDHPAASPSRHTEHKLPGVVRWPTWAAITVIGGASFGYFSWQMKKDQSDLDALNASSAMHTFDEAKAISDRGQRDSLLSNVSLGVALAAAAATVITYVVDDEVEVQPMAAPGSAGVSASIRF